MPEHCTNYALKVTQLAPKLPENAFQQSAKEAIHFFDFQAEAASALSIFMKMPKASLFVLQSENVEEHLPYVAEFLAHQLPTTSKISTYQVLPQAPFLILEEKRQKPKIETCFYGDRITLFGQILTSEKKDKVQIKTGQLVNANGGVLLLNVEVLLQDPKLLYRLKTVLYQQRFDWLPEDSLYQFIDELPSLDLNLKVILCGNRESLAVLHEQEAQLYHWANYAELSDYCCFKQKKMASFWQQWVQQIAQSQRIVIDESGVNALYQYLVRESEDKNYVALSSQKLTQLLQFATLTTSQNILEKDTLDIAFDQKHQQQNPLQREAYQAILHNQIYIETEGERLGQINGLSVVDYAGTPQGFGEPVRISCLVKFGDGEVVDVERKNELAGNVHSKGLMIAEACIANILNLPAQLPFSATVVFEQSYGEIDGDSASLACFLSLVSSLADEPLPQSIAVTGSIDQFGQVHTVGGVNEKIEGFFSICQARGLTGEQGVVIPLSVLDHLSLNHKVRTAVEQKKFHLWAVEDVNEACDIFFKKPLIAEEQAGESLVEKIHQRLGDNEEKESFWTRFFR